jgi:hypothetical protein
VGENERGQQAGRLVAGKERGNECRWLGGGDAIENRAFGLLRTAGGAKASQRGRHEEGAMALNDRGTG